jgi:hypothetical protein
MNKSTRSAIAVLTGVAVFTALVVPIARIFGPTWIHIFGPSWLAQWSWYSLLIAGCTVVSMWIAGRIAVR